MNIKINSTILILIVIIVLGIYAMPGILATFSGPHTIESGKSSKLDCLSCHEYIGNEITISSESQRVFQKHATAANNSNYTTFIKYGYHYNSVESRIYTIKDPASWDLGAGADPSSYIYWEPSLNWWIDNRTGTMRYASVNLEANDVPGIQLEEVCLFCHSSDILGASTHTDTSVSGCTDIKCHGNSNGAGYGSEFYSTVKTGYNLSNNNVHARWFKAMGNISSPYDYMVHDDSPVTSDYLTCIGCHTITNVNLSISKPRKYLHDNFNTEKIRYP